MIQEYLSCGEIVGLITFALFIAGCFAILAIILDKTRPPK